MCYIFLGTLGSPPRRESGVCFVDFRELNYVLAVARYQNITKAAESLYVGQPTVSKFLTGLEEELGLKLFRKIGNKYVLTYAGERYVEKARQILQTKADLDAELADILKRDVGVLNVGFAAMRCTYMLPAVLPSFRKLHPNVMLNVFEGSSDENDRRLLEGQEEIAFYNSPNIPNPQLSYETLCAEELLICTCRNHPLGRFAEPNPTSSHPRLDPALLRDERILMMEPDQRTRQIMDGILHEKGLQFSKVQYISSLPAIMELVSLGYGVSFIVETHLDHRANPRPIDCFSFGEPTFKTDFVAAVRKGSYISRYTRDFIEIVRRTVRAG